MSWLFWDPDEWETVSEFKQCACGGPSSGNCNGCCTAMASMGQRRRAPEDVKRIKAEKLRMHEDKVLVEAESIKARRAQTVSSE